MGLAIPGAFLLAGPQSYLERSWHGYSQRGGLHSAVISITVTRVVAVRCMDRVRRRINGSRQTQVVRGPPDHLFLLVRDLNILEAVLEAVPIADFSLDFEQFISSRELQLEFNDFSNIDVARDRRAQAAFSNVLGPADERFFCPDNDPQIQKITRMRSWEGPRMLFILGHSS